MKTTTKRMVYMTLPIIGYVDCNVELDIPTNIRSEEDIKHWVLKNYSTHNIISQESFDTDDIDWNIDEKDYDNRVVLDIE
jgi:hypothetical protein